MKFQNEIRMQMVMVGLVAALLMAGSARAQQDMDPSYFDANPGTPAVSKTILVKAQSPQAAKENASAESTLALANRSDGTLETSVARIAIVDSGIALILLAGVVLIARYAVAAARGARVPISKVTRPYTPVSAATAQ